MGIRIPQVFGDNVDLTIYDKNKGVGGDLKSTSFRILLISTQALGTRTSTLVVLATSHRIAIATPLKTTQVRSGEKALVDLIPKADFPDYYSNSDAIEGYLVKTWRKYGVDKYTQLNTQVTKAVWNEDTGKWDLTLKGPNGEFNDSCDVLLNGTGILNAWKWPDIEGLHTFKGKLLHTAAYDRSVPVEGKRVAVIGTGCVARRCLLLR
jgi:cation diffusion facilitator CzcD-associated flavoprotein CzcO